MRAFGNGERGAALDRAGHVDQRLERSSPPEVFPCREWVVVDALRELNGQRVRGVRAGAWASPAWRCARLTVLTSLVASELSPETITRATKRTSKRDHHMESPARTGERDLAQLSRVSRSAARAQTADPGASSESRAPRSARRRHESSHRLSRFVRFARPESWSTAPTYTLACIHTRSCRSMTSAPHSESVESLASIFHVDLSSGLTHDQVDKHREIYGENGKHQHTCQAALELCHDRQATPPPSARARPGAIDIDVIVLPSRPRWLS